MQAATLVVDIPERAPELAPATLQRHSITCYQWGNPKAPAVLCMHGLTRNGRDFDFLAAALAEEYYVLCPDMAGRGLSDRLNDAAGYNYATYLADTQYVLESLGISRVRWIGTSMGGIIGMMAANSFPGLIQSLVLNDVGCFIPAAGLRRIAGYVGGAIFQTREQAEAVLRETCASFGIREEAHWRHFFDCSLKQNADGTWSPSYDPAIAQVFSGGEITDIDLWQFWPAVTNILTLLLRGAESDILLRETAAEMRETHPALTLYEIAGAGHAPALMADDQIRLVYEWLDGAD